MFLSPITQEFEKLSVKGIDIGEEKWFVYLHNVNGDNKSMSETLGWKMSGNFSCRYCVCDDSSRKKLTDRAALQLRYTIGHNYSANLIFGSSKNHSRTVGNLISIARG